MQSIYVFFCRFVFFLYKINVLLKKNFHTIYHIVFHVPLLQICVSALLIFFTVDLLIFCYVRKLLNMTISYNPNKVHIYIFIVYPLLRFSCLCVISVCYFAGGKLVLPPPPTFSDEPFKPNPAPRPNKIATPIETGRFLCFTYCYS